MAYSVDEWKMILATSALLICMIWDIAVGILKYYTDRKVPSWIPSKLFTLNALTVLLLGNLDIQKGSASLGPSDENYIEMLVNKQLRTDVARLTMCVFVGCILPDLAMAGSQGGWSSVAALFVSLSFHVATEIYALQNADNNSNVERQAGPWFVSSGVLLSLAASSLLLLLGDVMLSGKLLRSFHRSELSEQDEKNEGNRWETLRIKVMKTWVAVRASKTIFFGFNSLLSPGSGMIVTVCVAVMAIKVGYRSSLLHHNNGGANLIFYLQCIFILVGWVVMLWRWFQAALCCKNLFHKGHFFSMPVFFLVSPIIVGDVLCPSLVVKLASSLTNGDFTLRRFLISGFCFVTLLPLFILTLAVSLMLLFCFICWYFSVLVFSSQFVQHLFKLDEGVSRNDKYSKYQSTLVCMNVKREESINFFWRVNKKSFDRLKGSINEQNWSALLSIMGSIRVAENQRLRLHDPKEHFWMKAVSIIFSVVAEVEMGVNMKDAFASYREARDMLKFVDCPDNLIVDPLNIFGNLKLDNFLDCLECEEAIYNAEKKLKQGLGEPLRLNQGRVNELVRSLNSLGEKMFNSPMIVMQCEEMFNSPALIRIDERCYDNMEEELSGKLCMLVGHVIVSCMLEAPDLVVKYAREWALKFDEEKIERAIELAGKVSGVLEKLVEDGEHIHSEEGERGQVASQSRERTSEADIGPAP